MAIKVNKYTTLTATLAASATTATLTSAAFDNGTQVPLVLEYDNSSKIEVILADIAGTALTNITRAQSGTSDVEHTGTPKIGQGSDPATWKYWLENDLTQEDWTNVTYQNNWVDSGTSNYGVGYMKDSMGFVHLRGACKSGTAQSVIFTLSAGYRPAKAMFVSGVANDLWAGIQIAANGQVSCFTNTNVYVDLDGITFKAE